MAYHAISSNKLRSSLSVLGITIGILCIILVLSLAQSLETNFNKSIESLGSDLVFVQKWPFEFGGEYPWWKYVNRPEPLLDECEMLKKRMSPDLIQEIGYSASVGGYLLEYKSESVSNVGVTGGTYNYDKLQDFSIGKGRYFTVEECDRGSNVIIIGSELAEHLFGSKEAVGKYVKLNRQKLYVVGVFKKQGQSLLGITFDDQTLVPINYLRTRVNLRRRWGGNKMIIVKPRAGVNIEVLEPELEIAMRSIRRLQPMEDTDFAMNRMTMIVNSFKPIFKSLSIGSGIIGMFSILVGGFGVANIMFVSVKERTSLIGIQKSLGAKRSFILMQFLIESVILSILGGLVGIVMVMGITELFEYLILQSGTNMDLSLTLDNVLIGVLISAAVGISAGIIPAYFASRLSPVEAIRSR